MFVPLKTDTYDTGFLFLQLKVDNRLTNISLDPLQAELLIGILGSHEAMRKWLIMQADHLRNNVPDEYKNKRRAGLSRLLSRKGWRLIVQPDENDVAYLASIQRNHPLKPQQVFDAQPNKKPEWSF